MAAATILSGPTITVFGNMRVSFGKLDSPANTNTYDTGLDAVTAAFITSCDATALAAADSLSITDNTAGVLTIGVAGTGRDCYVVAFGI